MEMARALGQHGLSAALHKHYPEEELVKFFRSLQEEGRRITAFYSMGIGKSDDEKFESVMARDGGFGDCLCLHRRGQRLHRGLRAISSRRCAAIIRTSPSWPATSSPAR